MDKVQAVHDYSEGLYERIQYTICPTEDDMDVHITSLDITALKATFRIRAKIHFPKLDISFYPECSPT